MAESSREWVVATVVGAAILWKLMCVWLRARRAKLIASFSPIEDAHTFHEFTTAVEFPFIANMSLQFALFRSYAIPSISNILAKVTEFVCHIGYPYFWAGLILGLGILMMLLILVQISDGEFRGECSEASRRH